MSYCDTTGPVIRVSHVESDVADHCNLSCAGCNHFAPRFRAGFYSIHDFRADLAALRGILYATSWYLIGGEPLLNPRLTDYARALKEAHICSRVDLWTNGLALPDWKDPELFPLLSTMVISRYPGVCYKRLDEWLEATKLPCQVREIKYGGFIHSLADAEQSPEMAQATFDRCKPRRSCHLVYRGRYYLCPQSCRIPVVLNRREIEDGCDLHWPDLEMRLRDHLKDVRPMLGTCKLCRAYEGPSLPHRQEPVPVSEKVGYEHS